MTVLRTTAILEDGPILLDITLPERVSIGRMDNGLIAVLFHTEEEPFIRAFALTATGAKNVIHALFALTYLTEEHKP